MERTVAVAGEHHPAAAWEDYAEIAAWARWAPPIRGVQADGERLVAGLTGTVRGPGRLTVPFTVTAVDPEQRTWEWEVGPASRRLRMRHEILARPGGGSVATLTVIGPALVVLGYPELARLALARLVGSVR